MHHGPLRIVNCALGGVHAGYVEISVPVHMTGTALHSIPSAGTNIISARHAGRLPPQWRPLSASQVQAALRAFDPTDSQYLAWHQLLLCLLVAGYPAVVSGSSWQLARALEHLVAADDDADGCLTQAQWSAAQLWFACADDGEEGAVAAEGTAEQQDLKALLWSLLAGCRQAPGAAGRSPSAAGSTGSNSSSTPRSPAAAGVPLLDIWAAMQVFCMGRDVQAAAARLAAVQQSAAAALSSAVSGGAGLPQLWMQWHDVYIAASHQELGAEPGVAALAGQP